MNKRPTPETDALCEKLLPLVKAMTAETFRDNLETLMLGILSASCKLERERDEARERAEQLESKLDDSVHDFLNAQEISDSHK